MDNGSSSPRTANDAHHTGHGTEQASEWVRRWSPLVPKAASVLDLACGRGRHSLWFARRGHAVTAVDKDRESLSAIEGANSSVSIVRADIENDNWPLPGQTFGCVVVTNYLWRPLLPAICEALASGGILIYETFASGNASVGRPRRPDFLLRQGELLDVCQKAGLRVIAYEDGYLPNPERFVQRVVAARWEDVDESEDPPKRWPLHS